MPSTNRAATVDVVASLPPQQLVRLANIPARDVEPDVECLICNASLAGRRSDESCGTCGTAIGRTLQGNFLKFAQPDYVRQLVKGLNLLLWGGAVLVIVAALYHILAFGHEDPFGFLLAAFAGGLTSLLGMWLVIAPAPNPLDAIWELKARKRIRIALIVAVAAPVVAVIGKAAGGTRGVAIAFEIVLLGLGAAAVVGIRESLLHLRKLALRIPSLGLARYTLYATWGTAICLGLIVAGGFIAALVESPDPAVEQSPGGFLCAGWLAVVGFGVMTFILLMQYRSIVTDQATFAEHTWAHPSRAAATSDANDSDAAV